jgi:WD40 repeat protein
VSGDHRPLPILVLLAAASAAAEPARVDSHGDPLPPGAVLRLGTVRLRHALGVRCVTYSPDGRLLASAGGDGRVCLWDAATGKLVRDVARLRPGEACFVAFSPDGKTLAGGGRPEGNHDDTPPVWLWDVATGKETGRLGGPEVTLHVAAFSADGAGLVTATQDGDVRLWNVKSGVLRWRAEGGGEALAVSPDGRFVASGGGLSRSGGGDIRLLDAATGRQVRRLAGDQSAAVDAAFAPDGKVLVTAGENGSLYFWEAATGKQLDALKYLGGSFAGTGHAVAFSPAGDVLAAGCGSKIVVWDAATRKELRRIAVPEGAGPLTFAPGGKTLAAGYENAVRTWDIPAGTERVPFDGHRGAVRASVSQDGTRATTATSFGVAVNWDLDTGRLIGPDDKDAPADEDRGASSGVSRRASVTAREAVGDGEVVTVSPDGRTAAYSGRKTRARLWDRDRHEERFWLGDKPGEVDCLGFSPDGLLLATGGPDAVRLWDMFSGREVFRLPGHRGGVVSVAFTPDGRRVLSGSDDTTALLWDLCPADLRGAARRLDRPGLERLWAELKGNDAAAYRAGWALALRPGEAVPFLKETLRPAAAAEVREVRRLVADLDSERFTAREAAARELARLGPEAEPARREALAKGPSAELRRRAEALAARAWARPSPAALRDARAVQVLERAATPEARRLVVALASGDPAALRTRYARAALDRLARAAARP